MRTVTNKIPNDINDNINIHKETDMPVTDKNKIMYTNGLVNLKDFPRGELIETKGNTDFYKVPEDVEVLTMWEGELKWVHPESYSVHRELRMFNVKTVKGHTLQCSDEHSLVTTDTNLNYIRSNPEIGMVMPRLKNSYDKFVKPSRLKYTVQEENVEFKLNFDLGYLFGAIIGDGWVNEITPGKRNNPTCIMLATVHDQIANKIEEVLKSYGYTGKVYTHSEEHEFDNSVYRHSKHTWHFKPVANLLRKHIGHKAINKHLPEFWANTPIGFRWGLLSGLIDTDGTVSISKVGRMLVAYSTTSQRLAYEISGLINSLGMASGVYIGKRKTGTIEYTTRANIYTIRRAKGNLKLLNDFKAKNLELVFKNTSYKPEIEHTPELALGTLEELRTYIRNKSDTKNYYSVSDVITKINNGKRYSMQKDIMLSIIETHPDFFEQNDFWKKYKSMVLDPNIEWLMIKEVTELKEITEAYDITCPPYCTFVMENGIVVYDTVSFNSVVTKESVREIDNLLASKSFYITPDGKLTYSAETDTLNYVLKHLSK